MKNESIKVGPEAFYEKQKEIHGSSATFLWIIFGVIAFVIEPAATFFSWQAGVYFVFGIFVAAVVFGGLGYWLQRLIARMLMRSNASLAAMNLLGVALLVADSVLIYFAARWTVSALFAPIR